MTHLQKSPVTGHLLKTADGHLVKTCPDCNACTPPIPNILYVTFAGLGGDWSELDDTYALPPQGAHSACWWYYQEIISGELLQVSVSWSGVVWYASLYYGSACGKVWLRNEGECGALGSYDADSCDDSGCDEGATCENSVDATCVVSSS